ncbi:hypothetical protein [uncultured Succinivibrio sp.]|uniref:hypothetical protein n=1 Tax=uncultured Succinivibrio sp. TaxID=540749 RepID=UPI0025E3A0D6|nr:hypothetical protein [uncultured Succinivibrio sp.]
MMLNSKTLSKESSKLIIEAIGRKVLSEVCEVSLPAVTLWIKNGMPFYRAQFLILKYPRLKVWKEIPEDIMK